MFSKLKETYLYVGAYIISVIFALWPWNRVSNLDVWYQIKTGEWIIENRKLMNEDVFSWTSQGINSAHEWLSSILFYEIHSVFGVIGVQILKLVILGLIFLVVYKWHKLLKIKQSFGVLFVALLFFPVMIKFSERPQLFTFLFLTLIFYWLEKFLLRKKESEKILNLVWNYFKWMPIIFILWTNLHGGVIAGIGLILCYAVLYSIKNIKTIGKNEIVLGIVALVSFLASLINPQGIDNLLYYFKIKPAVAAQYIAEWKPFFAVDMTVYNQFFLGVVIVSLIGLFVQLWRRKISWVDVVIVLIFCALAIRNLRHVTILAICLVMVGSKFWRGIEIKQQFVKYFQMLTILILAGLLVYALQVNQVGFGVSEVSLPKAGAEFLKKNNIKGNIFNSYGQGGYLIYELYPENKVFIDGRFDLYLENGVFEDYVSLQGLRENFSEVLLKYDFDILVIERWNNKKMMALEILDNYNDRYAFVYFDDNVLIFVRRTDQFADIIENHELRLVYPDNRMPLRIAQIDQEKVYEGIAEYERIIAMNSICVEPRLNLINILLSQKNYQEALMQIESVKTNYPELLKTKNLNYQKTEIARIGVIEAEILFGLQKYREAKEVLENVIKKDKNNKRAYYYLAMYYDQIEKDSKKGAYYFDKYTKLNR